MSNALIDLSKKDRTIANRIKRAQKAVLKLTREIRKLDKKRDRRNSELQRQIADLVGRRNDKLAKIERLGASRTGSASRTGGEEVTK